MKAVIRAFFWGMSVSGLICIVAIGAGHAAPAPETIAAATANSNRRIENFLAEARAIPATVPSRTRAKVRPVLTEEGIKRRLKLDERGKIRRLRDQRIQALPPVELGEKREFSPEDKKAALVASPLKKQSIQAQAAPAHYFVPFELSMTSAEYRNNMDYIYWGSYTATDPNADSVYVNFRYVDLERSYDRVYVVDAEGFECDQITGYRTNFVSAACPGNYAEIVVYTDSSINGDNFYDGFFIDGFTYTVAPFNTDPIAIGTADLYRITEGEFVYFDASRSYDLDAGDRVFAYRWSFGDGQSSTEPLVYHTYNLPGSYVVTLEVWDTIDGYDTDSFTIVVDYVSTPRNLSIAAATQTSLDVQWDSGGTDNVGYVIDMDEGNGSNLRCDLGHDMKNIRYAGYDDLKPGTTYSFLVCAYNSAGRYSVGTLRSFMTYANTNPIAVATADRFAITEGESILFDASGSYDNDNAGGVTAYSWDFGDGTPAVTTRSALHAFNAIGTYTVSLTVWDAAGGYGYTTLQVSVNRVAAPVQLQATLTDYRKLVFSWAPGGPETTKYSVSFGQGNGLNLRCTSGTEVNHTSNPMTRPYEGLTPGTAYSFLVCAYNSANRLSQGTLLTVSTRTDTAPLQPRIDGIRKLPNGNFEISFRAPEANRTYQLDVRTSLNPGSSGWSPLTNQVLTSTRVGEPRTFQVQPSFRLNSGFYQIRPLAH